MFWLVLAVLLVVVGIILIAMKEVKSSDRGGTPTSVRGIGILLIGLAFAFFAVGGVKHVPARNIGIPSSFSQVGADAYGPGYHETWKPWLNLTDATETIQTTAFTGCWGQYCTSDKQPRGNCLEVRIGGQQTACVDVTVKWQMNKATAGKMYLDYANQEDNLVNAVRDFLITQELHKAENTQLDGYNPITDAKDLGTGSNSQYLTFANLVETQVARDLGSQVHIVSVNQPLAYYTASTEQFLHQIQNKAAEDQVAILQQKVNADQKLALSNLGQPTTAQLQYLCVTSTVVHAAGWSCFGGNSQIAVAGK